MINSTSLNEVQYFITLLCYIIHKHYLLLQVNVVGVPVAD
jgi:hypothetical protein